MRNPTNAGGTGMLWEATIVSGASLVGFFDGFHIVWGTSASRVSVLGASIGGVQ